MSNDDPSRVSSLSSSSPLGPWRGNSSIEHSCMIFPWYISIALVFVWVGVVVLEALWPCLWSVPYQTPRAHRAPFPTRPWQMSLRVQQQTQYGGSQTAPKHCDSFPSVFTQCDAWPQNKHQNTESPGLYPNPFLCGLITEPQAERVCVLVWRGGAGGCVCLYFLVELYFCLGGRLVQCVRLCLDVHRDSHISACMTCLGLRFRMWLVVGVITVWCVGSWLCLARLSRHAQVNRGLVKVSSTHSFIYWKFF